jgi:hypothetical protein
MAIQACREFTNAIEIVVTVEIANLGSSAAFQGEGKRIEVENPARGAAKAREPPRFEQQSLRGLACAYRCCNRSISISTASLEGSLEVGIDFPRQRLVEIGPTIAPTRKPDPRIDDHIPVDLGR